MAEVEDAYWSGLMAKYTEMARLGSEHPAAIYPDPSLQRLLEEPVSEEADYSPPSVHTRDLTLGADAESFQIRVYTPDASENRRTARPLFVWVHGGAWAFGDLEGPEGDATAREVAARADAVVIAVDYRLARAGTHFPVPLDDVVAAYRWAVEHADELGVDRTRVVLGGASAGGNLAAGTLLRLAADGDRLPVAMVLAYASFHAVLPPASAELQSCLDRMSTAAGFKPEIYTPIVENYLGRPAESAFSPAMPGVADDLSVFPPTYLFNCEFDGLRASGERFAEQLRAAGVAVRSETVPGVAHGHLSRPGLPQSRQSHADLAAWVLTQTAVSV